MQSLEKFQIISGENMKKIWISTVCFKSNFAGIFKFADRWARVLQDFRNTSKVTLVHVLDTSDVKVPKKLGIDTSINTSAIQHYNSENLG